MEYKRIQNADSNSAVGMILSSLLLLLCCPTHAITWEDRGGEAIRLGVVTATTATPSGIYYSVTENGVIAESRDGGMTWAPVSLPQPGIHFNAVKFFDDTHGIAVGDGYLAYLNGGTSWQVVTRLGCKMNAVDMSKAHTAHIACDGSILVFSLNTGNFSKTSVESTNYNSVSFHDGVGYACGDGGRVAKYTDGEWKLLNNPDGGYDWVKYVLRTSGALTHIVASDRQTAYAMTDDGRFIKTIDGGLSWSERESGTGKGISSMNLIPGGDIAITGDGGRSYRLSDGTDRYSVRYYYDELGRIAASQTSRQQAMTPQRYSYISYDAMGRTVEAGEIEAQTPPTQTLMRSPKYPGNWGARRKQVVHTFYDKPQYASVTARFEEGVQENLRNRISSVIYMDEYDSDMLRYDHATHYSYDIHGNVKELLQEDRSLAAYGDDYAFHSIRYDYDLVSGNVNQVDYQNGQPDQFSMFYEYDSENRIQKVMSKFSGDEEPQTDATYEYYRHGPLARTVLGDGVQGMDYAYTLQGWEKGMNSENLGAEQDMGGDGKNGVASDVVGYTLSYNFNDYKPIAKGQTADFYKAVSEQDMTNLYTGNISRMATALANPESGANFGTQVRDFHYDVLNRLKSSTVQGSSAHATTYSYDANGNITGLTRNNANGDNFDKLTYRYEQDAEGNFINNRLLHVNDENKVQEGIDIKDQGVFAQNDPAKRNYAYDQQGNLISDKSEEIANIEWTATGKVRRITRTAQSRKPDLEFRYDALGNRVAKTVISKTDGTRITTYYVRDAKGTILATYTEKEGKLRLSEQNLYGAKRLGMRNSNLLVASTKGENINPENNSGEKRYELTNHLGNVLAVVSGKKAEDGSAQILSLTDYYPFGMEMDGRKYVKDAADGGYRYGFTGHEKEFDMANDVYTTDYRLLDARIGRWLSVDPLADKYAGMSPYNYCEGDPMAFIDPDGRLKRGTDGKIIFDNAAPGWWEVPGMPGKNLIDFRDLAEFKSFLDNKGINTKKYTDKQLEKMSVHLSFECMIGTVYTDNGDRGITAAQSSKQPKVQWILRDEDFNVVDFGRETPSEFVPSTYGADFSHNCTGKLADCSFFINSEDFTIENLKKDENYQVVKGKPKEGDFGIYYDPKTGKVQHVESFVMSEGKLMINTKGGAEQTEYSPESERGKDADFKKGNKYQIIRKIE